MEDLFAKYGLQFGTITMAILAVTEYWPLPIGTPGKTRKRYSSLIYAVIVGSLVHYLGFVVMPQEGGRGYIASALIAALSVATANLAVMAKKKLTGSKPAGGSST